jgi:hypothetical protein
MATENKVDEETCSIPTFERNRYFAGKPMMVGDFEAEQQYMIGKNRLQNRLIHGAGIICGLRLSNPKLVNGKVTVEISEGAALDCCGNLIAVNAPVKVEVQQESSLLEAGLGEGSFYLYIRFSECIRQPVMATTNASSCEEVCCYNRIRETFEIVLSNRSPSAAGAFFTGTVTTSDGNTPFVGAMVRALQQQVVKAETLTDNSGAFRLGVSVGAAFDIDASATGFERAVRSNQSIPAGQEVLAVPAFVLAAKAGAGTAPGEVCNELVQNYFEEHSLTCLGCDDPKVFLGMIRVDGTVSIDQNSPKTRQHRAVVYSNPLLHDLFCDHVSDFNNPHRTTAEQIRALQSVNNVGNVSGGPYVGNINLVSQPNTTIKVTPDANQPQIDLQLAADAVKPEHLNADTINGLLNSPDSSILIQPNTATKSITIRTRPATSVTSVGTAKVIGTSKNPAPEDHVHNLGDGVVTKPKLGEDVISTLLVSDGTVTITPNVGARQISIKTNRATQVTSVGKEKRVGASPNFSPEDHQHNFLINERGPDANGLFRLTAGKNVDITAGAGDNELVVSARTSQPLNVTTGLVRFEGVLAGSSRQSPDIKHGLKGNTLAVVLGLDTGEIALIGDLAQTLPSPLLILAMSPRNNSETFRIAIRDTRKDGIPATFTVRWWAIPFTAEMETVVSPPEVSVPQ